VNRDSIIKGLAVLSAVVLVLFVGYAIVKTFLNMAHEDLGVHADNPATLDANNSLKATIDTLEASWDKVQNYTFQVNQDPLHLGRVIKDFKYDQAAGKESDEESDIRLTATVVDNNPKAIIKFRGKSYVVQVGESIEKIYRVMSIEKQQVILQYSGGTLLLVTKPIQGVEPTDGQDGQSDLSTSNNSNYGNY
jgi:hypothetical protein